jgi:hypothetical protein
LEKISNLLDDVTIVNFKLIFKLTKRYFPHLYGAFFLFLVLFTYFYFNQPVIFSSKVPVKVMGRHALSRDLSDLQEIESTSTVNIGELNSMISSYTFAKSMSSQIVSQANFKNLNFGSILTGDKVLGKDILQKCKMDLTCASDKLTNYIGSLYTIEQGLTEDRFKLVINSLDEATSLYVAGALSKTIDKARIEVRQYMVVKEINSVTKLIDESRLGLQKENAFFLIEEVERNSQVIEELKEKMKILQSSLSNEIANLNSLEAKVGENQRVLKSKKNIDSYSKSKYKATQQKISDLRSNILSFSNVAEASRSPADSTILEQLKAEIVKLEKILPEEELLKNQEMEDAFGDQQKSKENDLNFEYLVSKNKVDKLENDYEETKTTLDDLQKDKIAKEADVNRYKSEIDFLKNLESKHLSLKLLSSTMTSDLQFEESGNSVAQVRKSSPIKVFFFASFLALFVLLLSLVFRYLVDDRIYSEDDIAPYLKNLDFFGEAPSFE